MFANRIARYVPLAAWVTAVLTLIFIPGRILSYGYLPADDALRHAAKVVSGKPWQEILVMRSDFAMDPHLGWHAVLGWIYHWQDCSAETLVVIAVFGLMLLVSAAVLPWFKRPEAWLAAMLVVSVAAPTFIKRLALARPFLFTMSVYLTLLLVWSRSSSRRPHPAVMLVTILLIAAAACIHGSFYQLVLPAAGLVLAGRWRQAIWFGACWTLGSVLYLAKEFDQAIHAFLHAVRWGTSDKPLYRAQLALARRATGHKDDNLAALYDQLMEVPCGGGYGQFVLGELAFHCGDFPRSRDHLQAFVNRTTHGRVALAVALKGELSHARRLLVRLSSRLREK